MEVNLTQGFFDTRTIFTLAKAGQTPGRGATFWATFDGLVNLTWGQSTSVLHSSERHQGTKYMTSGRRGFSFEFFTQL